MDFRQTSIMDIAKQVNERKQSASETVQAALANIERLNGELNCFCAVDDQAAISAAEQVDAAVARGEHLPLAGVPIGVKDLEDALGYTTTYGSALHANDPIADTDSELVRRLKVAGCIVVGKTNTPEFGHRAKTDNPTFGVTLNPWDKRHTPGGSSGGTAAAIAAGIVPLATGSDGGGSIRIPAALCGLSAIKTSQGRIPNGGRLPTGSGLLTVKGPMARTTLETAYALDATVGDCPTDIFALPDKTDNWFDAVTHSELPPSIIWSPTMGYAEVDSEVLEKCEAAIEKLEAAGVNVIRHDAIWQQDPLPHWVVFWTSARARAQQHLKGTADWDKIDPSLQVMIDAGANNITGAMYASAIDACHNLNYQLEQAFAQSPLIITPALCGHAPNLDGDGYVNGKESSNWVGFTVGLNMTRNPAGIVPIGCSQAGLPLALQVIGRQRDDLRVLSAMHRFEQIFEFKDLAAI